MGSDLYISVAFKRPGSGFETMFDGPSTDLARGPIVDFFGSCNPNEPSGKECLTAEQRTQRERDPECPWRDDEPYWVRDMPGRQFVDLVHSLSYAEREDHGYSSPGVVLRAYRAMVAELLREGEVVVTLWESQ